MKTLSLKLDDLQVETFETDGGEGPRGGTVKGHNFYTLVSCPRDTCAGTTCGRQYTLEGTCDETCGEPATCGYGWCGTYPDQGCPNTEWFCTDCQNVC